MIDSFKHKGMRKQLVETLKEKGIKDPLVLDAIGNVPRHFFLDSSFEELAYQDKAAPIAAGQTISHPFTVAFQTELLGLKKHDRVLEVGTGSGYQACVLTKLGVKVFSIERQRNLYTATKAFLKEIGYKIQCFYGDGYKGLPSYAPFEGIIVTAGAPFIPEDLLKQLKIGGRLVIPVDIEKGQIMTRVVRQSENEFTKEEFGNFSFVPMLNEKAKDL